MSNLHASLFSLCAERGKAVGFRMQKEAGGYRSVSYEEYRDKSLRLSQFLQNQGIVAGDRVLLVSENGPEWTMAALAVLNLGAVLVPVASIASYLEVQNIVKGAKPKFCFVSKRCHAARLLEEELNALKIPTFVWDLQILQPLERLIQNLAPLPISSVESTNTALLIYTSGTTGQPKAVPISHENVLTNALDVLKIVKASSADRVVSVLPLSHMLEFTGGFVVAMLAGATITYTKSLRPEDLLAALKDTKATIMIGVPLLFEVIARNLKGKLEALPGFLQSYFRLAETLTRQNQKLGRYLFFPIHKALGGRIHYFMTGGSRLQPQVYDYYRGLGIPLLQGYGLTETSPVLTVTDAYNAGPDHVGTALENVELGIFSDQGERLLEGVEGEIWARGKSIFRGYLDPAHNKDVFFSDWFRTGDLGTLDADGILRITGRKKDIIVTAAGKNVYPEEIEGVVAATGKFLEVAVLGMKDDAGHEKICLVLVPDKSKFLGLTKGEISETSSDIAAKATRTLSDYKWPQRIDVLFEELPKTSTRKVKKHEVRKLLEAGQEKQSKVACNVENSLNPEDALERAVGDALSSICRIDLAKICLTDSLTKDLGLDSLTFVELISSVEKKFNTQVVDLDFANILTIGDLVRTLRVSIGAKKRKSFFTKVFFADFPPENNLWLVWKLPRRLMNVALRAYIKIRHGLVVEGIENIRANTPYIFTPNHTSHFDMLSIGASVPNNKIHATFAIAAKDYFFNRTWKAIFARVFMNAIPFDRKGRVDESMAKCREVIDLGGSLTIFPEGTRSPNGQLQPFKPGVGQLLAAHSKAMAVPVYIEGAHEILPKGAHFPHPGKLRIVYGKPISFAYLPPNPESYKKIAERLQAEVVALSQK